MTLDLVLSLNDFWVGLRWDREERRLWLMLPLVGVTLTFGHRCAWCKSRQAQLQLADGRRACSADHYMKILAK